MMRGRRFYTAAAACLLAPMPQPVLAQAPPAVRAADAHTAEVETLAREAYVWGMPLVEAALIRERFSHPKGPGSAETFPINRFKHNRTLAGPEMRVGVGPNNDTIYSLAWLDLRDGPFVITTPDFGDRYYTFSINLADSSSEQSLGQRTHGGQMPPLFVHGPGFHGKTPAGMVDVPSSTRYINVAGRILVRSAAEYPEVHALQDRLAIHRWSDWRAGRPAEAVPAASLPLPLPLPLPRGPAGAGLAQTFFYQLGSVLRDWEVRADERQTVSRLRRLGISQRHGFRPELLSAADLAALSRGYEMAREDVRAASLRLGIERNGWTTNHRGPRFGKDYLLRAAVAKDQIFVAVPEEAIYPIARVDAEGRPLTGRRRYRIRFPADALPPVDAFWSITAYDDTGFMIPNPAQRYSVGDRTAGLAVAEDGSVTIELSAMPPAAGTGVNWLPVAADVPFYLMMRLYRPKAAVLDRSWVPPAIQPLDR